MTSHGTIQGYNGQTLVDKKHQVDLPPLFVPLFKLEFVQYSPVKTITKKDQSVKSL
jgi:hypothetical protein